MTFSDAQRQNIINTRLANAQEMLEDGGVLLARGSLRSAVNRCYYAVFYAASALAMRDQRDFRKHSGLIAYFHESYIKTGRLPQELGAILQRAFDDRCDADYDDLLQVQPDEAAELLDQAGRFVAEVKSHLSAT